MKFSSPANFGDMVDRNVTIKIGQVLQANFPKQEDGDFPGFITYDVMVNDKVSGGQGNVIYYDCMLSQMFGSAADYLEYSLRANVRPKNGKDEGQQDDVLSDGLNVEKDAAKKLMGAYVLVACIAGQAQQAVIVGFLPSGRLSENKNYKPQEEKDGKFLKFNFNGINVDINNDGELFLQRKGPTDPAGAIDDGDKETANSFVKINKAGEILISTTAKEDAQEASNDDIDNLILIDKKGNITIKIDGGKGISLKNKDSNAEFTLGDGAKHVAIAEEIQQLYTELKTKLEIFAQHTHPTTVPGSPTGVPVPPLMVPSWNSAIASQRMKVPK